MRAACLQVWAQMEEDLGYVQRAAELRSFNMQVRAGCERLGPGVTGLGRLGNRVVDGATLAWLWIASPHGAPLTVAPAR